MRRIILTGTEGVIGPALKAYLEKTNEVISLDKKFGHDLTDRKFVEDFFKENKADSLVNLFALNHHMSKKNIGNSFLEMDPEEVNEYCNVNVTSLYHVCREFIKNKERDKNISIVNFGSLYALRSPRPDIYPEGVIKHIGYVTSKHAVVGLTKFIAAHFSPDVRANLVCPGGIETNQMSSLFKSNYTKNVPCDRMGSPSDLCGIVELLCSEKSSYMNGCIIPVDGGWTCQ